MLQYANGYRRAITGASLAQLRRRMSAAERACLAADIVDGRVVLQGLTVKAIAAQRGIRGPRPRPQTHPPSTGTPSATKCSSRPSAGSASIAHSTP